MALSLAEKRLGPGIKNRAVAENAGIRKHKLDSLERFYCSELKGQLTGCQSDGTVASEVDTEINYLHTADGLFIEKLNIGTQVAGAPFPKQSTNGLDLAIGAQTNNLGAAFIFGGNHARGQLAFTVGTDEFYGRMKLKIADVSGADVCAFGFRLVQAGQPAFADYTDKACLNVNAGTVYAVTALNNGADDADSTSVTVADAGTVTLEVQVNLGGQVSYLVDGVDKTSLVSGFVFDSGDVVVPFFDYLNDADVVGTVECSELKIGLKDTNVRQPTE